jgi:hypothetical protein
LEKEFFKDSDSDNEVDAEPKKPKAAVIASKLPAPDFVSCLDSDGDDDEDDLLAPSIFAKKSVPSPPTKLPSTATTTTTATTTATGVELSRNASTKPIISSPACPYENDDLEDRQGDGIAAPWSASPKESSKDNIGDGDSSQLLQCVDRCFREEDIATVTFNKISSAVERELSIKLQPEQRKIVRARLMSLIESPVKEKSSEQPVRAVLEPAEQPMRAVLEPAVDAVLSGFSDKGKCTIKEIIIALQSQFDVIFTEETKIIVRKRLIYTLNNPSPSAASTAVEENKTEPLASLEPNRQLEVEPGTSVGPVTRQLRDQSTTTTTTKGKGVSSLDEANKRRKPSKSVVEKAETADPNTTVANQKTKGRKPPKARKDDPIDGKSNIALPSPAIKVSSVEETVVPGKTLAPERKKRGRPSRPAVNTAIAPTNNNSDIPPAKAPRKAAPTRARKRARGSCSLCSNCPCTNDTAECNAFDAMGTAQSDAAQEKDLMKRLLKLEKTAERYEDQTDAVRRKLKKHRRDMWRKHEAAMQVDNTGWPEQSRFLPDVKELEQRLDGRGAKARVSPATVQNVQSKMFSFAQNFQPTLTQMFGGGGKKDTETETTEDANLDTFESLNLETIEEEPEGLQVEDFDGEAASKICLAMDAEEASMMASDEEDDEGSEGVEVDAHRIEWKDGAENSGQTSPVVSGPSIWRSLMTGGVECTWDRLFDEELDDESAGIDHLLGMLDDPKNAESVSKSPTVQAACPVEMEMLSQRGQLLAEEILSRIESDKEKVEILEAACPSWKENIIFALFQQESEDVHEALERVKRSKAKLLRVKQEIMASAQRQEAVLNVFEDALRTSLSRVQGSNEDDDADGNDGFFPTQAPESPRTIFDGEENQDSSPTRAHRLSRDSMVLTNVEDDFADFTPDNDTAQDPAGTTGDIEQETNPSSPPFGSSTPLNCGRQSLANTPHSAASGDTIIESIAS